MSKVQFGFRSGIGTREALFSIQVLKQRARAVNWDFYACFIDFEKAFDRVQHHKLFQILMESGIDNNDLRLITNMYLHHRAHGRSMVRIDNETSEEFTVKRGVRQGCILSPTLTRIPKYCLDRRSVNKRKALRSMERPPII